MITPLFTIDQDDKTITFQIRAPYCSLADLNVEVVDDVFYFACKPYYLKLNLPGEVHDMSTGKWSFDANAGEFSITLPKRIPGEHFEDLELITKFLFPPSRSSKNADAMIVDLDLCQTENGHGFGFGLKSHKDYIRVSSEFNEVFEINPDEVPLKKRGELKFKYEQGKFNEAHYLLDLHKKNQIPELISQKPPSKYVKNGVKFQFTTKELEFLKDLRNIEYTLTDQQIVYCQNGLLDILFAYCYDQRISEFEGSSESGWNITKLASTLSWLDVFPTPKDALVSAFRRCMIYPLYRHFGLATSVFEDLKLLISTDIKHIVRVLIEIYHIFLYGDCAGYILNDLFIKDYIVYIMKWGDQERWQKTVQKVLNMNIVKEDLKLNLKLIEAQFWNDNVQDSSSSDSSDSSSSECSSDSEMECDEVEELRKAIEDTI